MKEWYEIVLEIADIHSMFLQREGQSPAHRPKNGKRSGWSVGDTAKELELSKSYVAECIQIAKAINDGKVKLDVGLTKITVLRIIRNG